LEILHDIAEGRKAEPEKIVAESDQVPGEKKIISATFASEPFLA
jgi:hypothetical protein